MGLLLSVVKHVKYDHSEVMSESTVEPQFYRHPHNMDTLLNMDIVHVLGPTLKIKALNKDTVIQTLLGCLRLTVFQNKNKRNRSKIFLFKQIYEDLSTNFR